MHIAKKIRNIFHIKSKREILPDSGGGARLPGYIDLINGIKGRELNVATVYRCVSLLGGAVSILPIQHEVMRGKVYKKRHHDMLNYLMNVEPNEYMNAVEFWTYVVCSILLRGNAYIVPTRDKLDGNVWRLACVNPDNVTHDAVLDTYRVNDVKAGVCGTFEEEEVIHIKNIFVAHDGKNGISTLEHARITTHVALAGEAETLERMQNGGNVRGIVSETRSPLEGFGPLQDAQLAKKAESLDDKFRSGERIVSVPGSVSFSPITLSSQDMQFLENRKLNVTDICRFFNVPPQLAFHDQASNYKTSEMAWVAFLNGGLAPLIKKIEEEFTRKLIGFEGFEKERIVFDKDALYSCDLLSKAKYQASTIASGIYTVNEWREKENKEPIEGGDRILISANLKDINDIGMTGKPDNEGKEEDGEEGEDETS